MKDPVETLEHFEKKDLGLVGVWTMRLWDIKRWNKAPEMLNPTNVLIHTLRGRALADFLLSLTERQGLSTNRQKVSDLALHHDDPKFVTEDIPTPIKQQMTPGQKISLKTREEEAATLISTIYFPSLPKNQLKQLHGEYEAGETLEAQIVRVADKLDALGEVLHEVYCGNQYRDFWIGEGLHNLRTIFDDLDTYGWWKRMKEQPDISLSEFPKDQDLPLDPQVRFTDLSSRMDLEKIVKTGGLVPIYRTWVKTTLQTFPKESERYLFPG